MTPSPDTAPLIHIFIGAPIENRSEHDCLRAVSEALAKMHSWAYIFANFYAARRQIDLTVFTEKATLVIEAKGYSHPVQGGVNGRWEQLGAGGARKIGNAYDQALGAKNALRDEMQRINQIEGYPNGLVAVTPLVPKGSDLTPGDYKVVVAGQEQIAQQLTRSSGALFTQDQCEALARQLGLEAVASAEAALNDEVLVAERRLDTYLKSFCDFYGPLADELVNDQYNCGDLAIGLSEVRSMVTDDASGVLIHGPSGCGKTLLTTSCAISSTTTGCVPIFVSAKNFDGKFQRLLDTETALLNTHSTSSLITAARLLGKRVILFLDGYNECGDEFKVGLTRSLRAFALRYGPGIVVSTQQNIVRADLLTMKTVIVKRPRLCAGPQYARRDVQVALAPSVSAHSLCLRSRFGTAAAVLRASRALFRRTRGSPTITGRRIDVLAGGLRPPARTLRLPRAPRPPWLGRLMNSRQPLPGLKSKVTVPEISVAFSR